MREETYYIGTGGASGNWRCTVAQGNSRKPLAPRYDLRNHSPDGFAWGYNGSGPAQLALALCAHVLDSDSDALRVYMQFKSRWLARLPSDGDWSRTKSELRAMMQQLLERAPA
jgi:hypothetical protein